MRFGSMYDAGDEAVRENIVTFAATKLLNVHPQKVEELSDHHILACLSQRLPLKFHSASFISQARELKQVQDHMRVCLPFDADFESITTACSSEPLLSEAAYSIMAQPSFNAPKAFKSVLDGFSMKKGERGEFLVMLLFTIARDKVAGPPDERGIPTNSRLIDVGTFLTGGLFRNLSVSKELLADFPHAKMHFNHYIEAHENGVITAESLLLYSTRGAGLLCPVQYGITGVNPFLFHGTKLVYENLGLILWQSMNSRVFTDKPQDRLFRAMDVYELNILEKGDAAIPRIKIVFALAAKKPSLHVRRRLPSSDYNAIVYEIWCAGISSETFNAVETSQETIWSALLEASYDRQTICEGWMNRCRGISGDISH
jgi:hypothetical protein